MLYGTTRLIKRLPQSFADIRRQQKKSYIVSTECSRVETWNEENKVYSDYKNEYCGNGKIFENSFDIGLQDSIVNCINSIYTAGHG